MCIITDILKENDVQLTENFNLDEITNIQWDHLNETQKLMISNLTGFILQPIREHINMPMWITSGMRTQSDINRLRKQGYFPSETSDHLFGNVVELTSKHKIEKYGLYYPFSVGAVDFICKGVDMRKVFKLIYNLVIGGIIKVGQLIYERKKSGTEWIHISNPVELIYSKEVRKLLARPQFLYTLNGGANYKLYDETVSL
jgi:uncharacterized protein YcbK (DUF882 family)